LRDFARPRIVSSKCLEFAPCRYNEIMISSPVVRSLKPHVDFTPVCPEVEIGLGVPRDPIRIVKAPAGPRLVQPKTGRDLTGEMSAFVEGFLGALGRVDGFILKSRSPSCGIKDTKVYAGPEKTTPASRAGGFFGGRVVERFPGLAVEDEGRLTNLRVREHFLTKVFALAALRGVEGRRNLSDLVVFHTDNKLLLMAYSQKQLRLLGRLVGNHAGMRPPEILRLYRPGFETALARPARAGSCINVLLHALGYFSRKLGSKEKAFFLDALGAYREGRSPLSVPVGIMKSYLVRFGEPYLERQTFLAPYPDPLASPADSGRGRDL
jgi:uncharacterized protein YbgA (DUF1722 family)/uncharacterized protein YbbK (DUF523 family)